MKFVAAALNQNAINQNTWQGTYKLCQQQKTMARKEQQLKQKRNQKFCYRQNLEKRLSKKQTEGNSNSNNDNNKLPGNTTITTGVRHSFYQPHTHTHAEHTRTQHALSK